MCDNYPKQMNIFDRIKDKPKENYNVIYSVNGKILVFRADDEVNIQSMRDGHYVPIRIESIDGTEFYDTIFSVW